MKKLMLAVGAFGVLWLIAAAPVPPAAHAHDRDDQDREPGRHRVERADDENTSKDFVPPTVFQAAGGQPPPRFRAPSMRSALL